MQSQQPEAFGTQELKKALKERVPFKVFLTSAVTKPVGLETLNTVRDYVGGNATKPLPWASLISRKNDAYELDQGPAVLAAIHHAYASKKALVFHFHTPLLAQLLSTKWPSPLHVIISAAHAIALAAIPAQHGNRLTSVPDPCHVLGVHLSTDPFVAPRSVVITPVADLEQIVLQANMRVVSHVANPTKDTLSVTLTGYQEKKRFVTVPLSLPSVVPGSLIANLPLNTTKGLFSFTLEAQRDRLPSAVLVRPPFGTTPTFLPSFDEKRIATGYRAPHFGLVANLLNRSLFLTNSAMEETSLFGDHFLIPEPTGTYLYYAANHVTKIIPGLGSDKTRFLTKSSKIPYFGPPLVCIAKAPGNEPLLPLAVMSSSGLVPYTVGNLMKLYCPKTAWDNVVDIRSPIGRGLLEDKTNLRNYMIVSGNSLPNPSSTRPLLHYLVYVSKLPEKHHKVDRSYLTSEDDFEVPLALMRHVSSTPAPLDHALSFLDNNKAAVVRLATPDIAGPLPSAPNPRSSPDGTARYHIRKRFNPSDSENSDSDNDENVSRRRKPSYDSPGYGAASPVYGHAEHYCVSGPPSPSYSPRAPSPSRGAESPDYSPMMPAEDCDFSGDEDPDLPKLEFDANVYQEQEEDSKDDQPMKAKKLLLSVQEEEM